MKADPQFLSQPREFWANVRTISQAVGYTKRGVGLISIPVLPDIRRAYGSLKLNTEHIANEKDELTDFGKLILAYFQHRANVLNDNARMQLMNKEEASDEFKRLRKALQPRCPLPMNKQSGRKKKVNFLTCIVNMLIEANIGDAPCNYNPLGLTTVTHNGMPLRTLSRRVDGAFPSIVNPVAIWEIKEYYYTTTFGSRVADGVYETLVDGMELEELELASRRKIYHVLFVDAYDTWWMKGRSYLCRLVDMLHMGLVDEVVFGREAMTRIPEMATEWKAQYHNLKAISDEPTGIGDLEEAAE